MSEATKRRAESLLRRALKAAELPKSIRKIIRERERRAEAIIRQAWWNK